MKKFIGIFTCIMCLLNINAYSFRLECVNETSDNHINKIVEIYKKNISWNKLEKNSEKDIVLNYVNDKNYFLYVYLDDENNISAYARLENTSEKVIYMHDLIVLGQKGTGIGTKFMNELFKKFENYKFVLNPYSKKSICFYEKLGFEKSSVTGLMSRIAS